MNGLVTVQVCLSEPASLDIIHDTPSLDSITIRNASLIFDAHIQCYKCDFNATRSCPVCVCISPPPECRLGTIR